MVQIISGWWCCCCCCCCWCAPQVSSARAHRNVQGMQVRLLSPLHNQWGIVSCSWYDWICPIRRLHSKTGKNVPSGSPSLHRSHVYAKKHRNLKKTDGFTLTHMTHFKNIGKTRGAKMKNNNFVTSPILYT